MTHKLIFEIYKDKVHHLATKTEYDEDVLNTFYQINIRSLTSFEKKNFTCDDVKSMLDNPDKVYEFYDRYGDVVQMFCV